MPTYTFRCPNGHIFDLRATRETTEVDCCCSATAQREQVYAVNFGGFAAPPRAQRTYHQEFKDFDEAGAELEYKHSRMEEEAGKQLPTPPLATIAKREARRLRNLGVKDSEDWKARLKH